MQGQLETKNLLNIDELKAYFGEDYWVNDKIRIMQPTINILVRCIGNDTMYVF